MTVFNSSTRLYSSEMKIFHEAVSSCHGVEDGVNLEWIVTESDFIIVDGRWNGVDMTKNLRQWRSRRRSLRWPLLWLGDDDEPGKRIWKAALAKAGAGKKSKIGDATTRK